MKTNACRHALAPTFFWRGIRYGSGMVEQELPQGRRNYVSAYLHFDSQTPDDIDQALADVVLALKAVEKADGSEEEALMLARLAGAVSGLRERLDATTVDIAIRLRRHGLTVARVAEILKTVRPTIDTWLKKLDS